MRARQIGQTSTKGNNQRGVPAQVWEVILFLPFFVPCLTIGLGHLTPATPERSIGVYLWMSLVLFVIWLLGGWRAGTGSWLDRITLLAVLLGFPTGLVVSLVGLGGERLFLLVACLLSPLLTARLADALAWDAERGEPLMLAVFSIGILAEFPLHGWLWQSGSQAGQPETYPLLRQSVCAGQSNWVTKGTLVLLVGAHAVTILGCFFGGVGRAKAECDSACRHHCQERKH